MHGPVERQGDIERTAKELLEAKRLAAFSRETRSGQIRSDYLRKWTGSQYPPVVRNLNAASLLPDLTGDEFKKLYVLSRLGDGEGKGIVASREEIAALMYIDERRWKRVRSKLEEKGCLSVKPTVVADGGPGFNRYTLENPVLSILRKIDRGEGVTVAPSPGGHGSPLGGGQTRPKGGVTVTPQNGTMEDNNHNKAVVDSGNGNLSPEDAALHFEVMNAFSCDPRYLAVAGVPVMPKRDADANLASRFSGLAKSYPPEVVLRCLRTVLADMQLRAHDRDRTKLCPSTLSGFSGYLTKCMNTALVEAMAASERQPSSVPKAANGHAASNGADPPLTRAQRAEAIVQRRREARQKELQS